MVKEILKVTTHNDEVEAFLSQPCKKITDIRKAREIVKDLIDTALHNNEHNGTKCCGLAANQIGINARVIIAQMPNGKFEPFINPVIVDHSKAITQSTEGCMSLEGTREVPRYHSIILMAQDISGRWNKRKFTGFTAIELQHEIDHTNGVLI